MLQINKRFRRSNRRNKSQKATKGSFTKLLNQAFALIMIYAILIMTIPTQALAAAGNRKVALNITKEQKLNTEFKSKKIGLNTGKKSDNNSRVKIPPQPVKIDFEDFETGNINGQKEWRSPSQTGYGNGIDAEVTDNTYFSAPKSFGSRSLRLSNAVANDAVSKQIFADSLIDESGESTADNLGQTRGERGKLFTSEWEFAAADSNSEQFGLSVVASPTRNDGAQMSYVRMVDTSEGVGIFFKEYRNGAFSEVVIASGLDRTQAHKIRLDISFEEGAGNDIVKVYVDNELRHEGTTWEDFYRENGKSKPPTVDTISFNTDGSPYPANRGKGFLIDNIEINSLVAPQVLSITRHTPTAQIVNATSVVFRVVFDTAVNSVDAGDFSFTGSTVGGSPQITNINTSSPFTTYDVTVTNYTGDGNLQLNVIVSPTNPIRSDPGNDPITTGFNSGQAYTIDNTAPIVSSITLPGANPTTAASVTFTVNFSENVQGVDSSDFSISTTGTVAHGGIASISNAGPVYTVIVTGISGDGTIGLNVLDDNTITDFVSPTPYSLNGSATGPTYTVDNTEPSVSISPLSGTFTTSPITFTAEFSEDVSNFVVGDIVVGNGNAGNLIAVDGNTYTFDVTPSGNGTITVNIPAGVANDNATNPNTAATQASVIYDGTAPIPVVSTMSGSPTNVSPIPFTINFGEAVNGFTAADVTVSGGTVTPASFTGVDGDSSYSFTVTPSGDGTVSVSVAASVAQDTAGNNNNPSNMVDVVFDSVAPTVTVGHQGTNPTMMSPITFTFMLSEPVVGGLTIGDITPGNGTTSNFQILSATSYTVDITPTMDGEVTATVDIGEITDAAGNSNMVAGSDSVTFDDTDPSVVSINPSSGTFSNSPINFTVTFSEPVSDFEDADLTDVTLSGTALPITFAITGGPTVYNVAVGGMSMDGSVTIQIPAGAAIDNSLNPNTISAAATVQRAATQVLTSANSASKLWYYTNDQANPPSLIPYNYVQGPTGQPLGEGSARLAVTSSSEGKHLAHFGPDFLGVRLDKITKLTFDTYSTNPGDTASLQLGADYDLTDGVTGFQGRLVYVPSQNGTITPGTWQSWDATNGLFWATRAPMNATDGSGCPISNPCTRAELLTKFPNVGINTNAGLGSVGFKIGSGSSNAEVFVDNFTIGVNGNDSTFDFEPILPTVTVEQASGQNDPTNASPILFTVDFSETVTDFDDLSDVQVTNGTISSITDNLDTTFTVAVTPSSNNVTVTANVLAGVAQGSEGLNTAATFTDNTVDYNVPTVSIAANTAGSEPGTPATFTVSLSATSLDPVTVLVSTTDGSATAGSDYTALVNQPVTIPANTMSVPVSVAVLDDTIFEPTETFTATLSSPTNATLGTTTATGSILDDGTSVVSINPAASADEGSSVVFTVSINEPNANPVTVNYTLADVTTSATDYTAPSGSVIIPANTVSATITVQATDDNIDEPNETFTVTLNSANNGATIDGTNNVGTGTINDNDDAPAISIDSATVTEGGTANFMVSLSNPSATAITVDYVTADNSAVAADGDYTAISTTTLTFNPGETSKPVSVSTNDDAIYELTETFNVNLSNNSVNSSIGTGTGVGTINDNEPVPTVSIANTTGGAEPSTNNVFTVTLSGLSSQAVTVDVNTSNGTATAGSDYTALVGSTVTIPANSLSNTFSVVTLDDNLFEGNENFTATISNPTVATLGLPVSATGTITETDVQPTVQFDPATASGNETDGSSIITITATRTGASGDAFTVDVNFTDSGATGGAVCGAGVDYVNAMTTLNFAAGETTKTFDVPICGDTIFEGDETFVATLSNPSAPVNLGTSTTATVNIIEGPEQQPTVSISDAVTSPTAEGSSATFNVNLSNESDEQIDVSISISAGTAGAADYSLVTTSVSFPANTTGPQTVTVNALTDNLFEGPTPETFTVNLVSVTSNNATIANGTGAGSISDVDVCNLVVTPTSSTAYPIAGGSGTFSVTVTNGCEWSAAGSAPWITSTSTGNGNGTGSYTIADNTATLTNSGAARNGMVIVSGTNNAGNDNFAVSQAAAPVNVVIPSNLTTLNGATLTVPVQVTSTVTGRNITAFDFDLNFDDSLLDFTGVSTTTMTNPMNGWLVIANNPSTGLVAVSGTSGSALIGSGDLVFLTFTVTGNAPSCSAFDFVPNTFAFLSISGNPTVSTSNGQACIIPGEIKGTVRYGNAIPDIQDSSTVRPVNSVTLTASPMGLPTLRPVVTDVTDVLGEYLLPISFGGQYDVVPSRANYPRLGSAITSDDASYIQRLRVGLEPALTPGSNRFKAADVDQNSTINSLDASLVQQFKAGITNPANFTGNWQFINSGNSYTNANQVASQTTDYTAILIGDVTGNWSQTFTPPLFENSSETKPIESVVAPQGAVPVLLPTTSVQTGANFDLPIFVGNVNGENVRSADFDVIYNPAVITPQAIPVSNAGTMSGNCSVIGNVITPGRLAVSIACVTAMIDSGSLINLKFTAIGNNGTNSALSFDPFIFNSGIPPTVVTNGNVSISVATSANGVVKGRLIDAGGRGVSRATVILTGSNGGTRTVVSNNFGNFIFEGVATGETYTVSVTSKAHTFTPQVVSISEDVTELNLVAEP